MQVSVQVCFIFQCFSRKIRWQYCRLIVVVVVVGRRQSSMTNLMREMSQAWKKWSFNKTKVLDLVSALHFTWQV